MSETIYRCSLGCGWSGVLDPTEVAWNSRCPTCTTGRPIRVYRPTDDEWNGATA